MNHLLKKVCLLLLYTFFGAMVSEAVPIDYPLISTESETHRTCEQVVKESIRPALATGTDQTLPAEAPKKVIILGASGSLATYAIDLLVKDKSINLTLFLRDKSRLRTDNVGSARIVEGDVFDYNGLRNAIQGQDVIYANLSGDLGRMAKNIVKAMNETGVKQLIFICSIGMYNEPVKPVLIPYRQAADVIEASNLDYTILRPTWFSDANEVDYEITKKGEPEKGSTVSRKSIASFITEVIRQPGKYKRQSLGINKPTS